jgi:hypothetical protein
MLLTIVNCAHLCAKVRMRLRLTSIILIVTRPKLKKRVLLLIQNDEPVGREPQVAKAKRFDKIVLPEDTATMDDCCGLTEKLKLTPGRLNVGFLELVSNVELNVVAVYTATDLKSESVSIDVETISARRS